ncbi:MAG: KdsC family phosphatase [Pyrinomonadaceae bacterium]
MNTLSPELFERAAKIRLLLVDCDGVLTDGRLYYSAEGEALKVFDVQDGQGIVTWLGHGLRAGIISGRSSPIVGRRAADLKIDIVRQGVTDKLSSAIEVAAESGVSLEETAFIGDDFVDLDVMAKVGLSVAVANAVDEVKAAAHLVTERSGGRGAVRELIDVMLGCRGRSSDQ